jgi:hypothetical protein
MMIRFSKKCRYVHDTAKDLAIEVVAVKYQDSKRIKLLIKWVDIFTGKTTTIPGGRVDGTQIVTIQTADLQYWSSYSETPNK